MYGASRFVGIGPPVALGGRMFWVRARTIGDYAALEAVMQSLRGNPFDSLRRILLFQSGPESKTGSEIACREIVDRLRDGWWNVKFSELLVWLGTWEGRLNALALAIRQDAGDVARWLEESLRESDGKELDEWWHPFQQSLDAANGDNELGTLQWLENEASGKKEDICWAAVFRDLGDEPFCKSVQEIEQMTLEQVRAFQCKRESLNKTHPTFPTPEAAAKYSARVSEKSQKVIEELKKQIAGG